MRIIIAEDAAILRDGLAQLLGLRGRQVITVGDAVALHAAVAEDLPDIAVIDIRMPPTHTDEGLRAAIDLRRQFPGLGVLLFSQYVETRFVGALLAEGSSGVGYLLKERVVDIDDFIDALDRIASGALRWIPRSSPSSSAPAAAPTVSRRSPHGNARCSPSWPKAAPMPRSRSRSS